MTVSSNQEQDWAKRWDELYTALSAEPRRMILASLLDAPPERRLPMPDAAESPNQPMDSETLTFQLQHHHLPLLAETGYVDWKSAPFVVERGPRFEEPAFIMKMVIESFNEIPESLINNCKIFIKWVEDERT